MDKTKLQIAKATARIEADLALIKQLAGVSEATAEEMPIRNGVEIADFTNQRKCLRCELPIGKSKSTRGVHEKCYQLLRRQNKLDLAERCGYILPAAKPGPKAADPIPKKK
jgi:hypothetical protein